MLDIKDIRMENYKNLLDVTLVVTLIFVKNN